MEGLQFDNALDLNIGYYTIRFLNDSEYMTTEVTESGKFKYNCLPMGMCASRDILQYKLDEIIGDSKGV